MMLLYLVIRHAIISVSEVFAKKLILLTVKKPVCIKFGQNLLLVNMCI